MRGRPQVKIIKKLLKRKNKFDAIIIETTGMADPGDKLRTAPHPIVVGGLSQLHKMKG